MNTLTVDDVELFTLLTGVHGYSNVRRLPDGRVIGTQIFMFTAGLLFGLDEHGVEGRYCYERMSDAVAAASTWNGEGDPPGPWIKYKGIDGERLGPGATK